MGDLIGMCRELIANSSITTAQSDALELLDAGPLLSERPGSEIAQTMERILEDGIVTKEEKSELRALIQEIFLVTGPKPP